MVKINEMEQILAAAETNLAYRKLISKLEAEIEKYRQRSDDLELILTLIMNPKLYKARDIPALARYFANIRDFMDEYFKNHPDE